MNWTPTAKRWPDCDIRKEHAGVAWRESEWVLGLNKWGTIRNVQFYIYDDGTGWCGCWQDGGEFWDVIAWAPMPHGLRSPDLKVLAE